MGGNIKVGNYAAQEMDMSKTDRTARQHDINNALKSLHNTVKKNTGRGLFGETGQGLKAGNIFAGSTRQFMDKNIPDEEHNKFKPKVGDIDVMYDARHKEALEDHLKEGEKHGKFTIVGVKKHGTQVSALMQHEDGQVHQIDFEPAEYKDNAPSEWAQFSHSANWNDTRAGMKGAFHKFLLSSLTAAHGQHGIIRNNKGDESEGFVEQHAFSVDRGLRNRHEQIDTKDGKPVVKELKPQESKYTTGIHDIYKTLLGKKPQTQTDIDSFGSFQGLAELAKRHLSHEQKGRVIDKFVNTIYHPKRAQLMHQDHHRDEMMKEAALNHMRKTFPEHFTPEREEEIKSLKKQFYESKKK